MTAASPHAFDPAAVDFQKFALFLDARRVHRRKTVLRVAREAEVPVETVQRAIRARNPGEAEFFALCAWIGEPPALFLKPSRAKGREAGPGLPAGSERIAS